MVKRGDKELEDNTDLGKLGTVLVRILGVAWLIYLIVMLGYVFISNIMEGGGGVRGGGSPMEGYQDYLYE